MLKADFHLHVREDPCDRIKYSAKDAIDIYKRLGFKVMTFTCHDSVCYSNSLHEYAKKKGILLLKGMEARVEGKDVIIINPTNNIPRLKLRHRKKNSVCGRLFDDFEMLDRQRDEGAVTIAPHPFYIMSAALGNKLYSNINKFDAIEHCHFYTKWLNRNNPARKAAKMYKKPVVASSDAHNKFQMNTNYTLLDSELNKDGVLEAIRKGNVEIRTRPLSNFEFLKVFNWATSTMLTNTIFP
jgi:predicted metal-dependent phosphoesterase TrpH